jgi:hypothetical protein
MTLKDAFNEHLVKGQQGQLVIKFSGEAHLCKILIEDGQAVHISHGRLAPDQILDSLADKVFEWANFISGYPVRKKLDFPLHDRLFVAISNKTAQTEQPVAIEKPDTPQAEPAASSGETIGADKVNAAIDGFIELIGPLGTILAEQTASALNYTSGTPMPETSYNKFIQALAKEVPAADRTAFTAQFKL